MTELRIAPIGTCRIHTPLRRGASRYPIELELGRNYGFVHSASEALQQIRFVRGELKIDPAVMPLVARERDLSKYDGVASNPVDLHVVEVSSAKKLSSGDYAVQRNYVYRHFADFFASNERSRTFWSLVRKGHRGDLVEFLGGQRMFRLLSHADRDLLLSLKFEQQSFKEIKADMEKIVEELGPDKLIFVTHVNASTADGAIVAGRDRLIRWVKLAGDQLGVKVFDPTPAMKEVGQEMAMTNGGLDLAHYTPVFSDRIYEELHKFHIGSLLGSALVSGSEDSVERQIQATALHLEAMLEVGDFVETAKEINAALRRWPDAPELLELRGVVRSRTGDYAGAVEDLSHRPDEVLSQPMRFALLESLGNVGDSERVLAIAANLFSDEYQDADAYRIASEAAERLGDTRSAVEYAKQAFRLDRADISVALRALKLLASDSSTAELASQWRDELLENVTEYSNGAFELCNWAVEQRDEQLFEFAIRAVIADKGATLDLAEDAFRAGMYNSVASSIRVLAELGRLPPKMASRRAAFMRSVLEKTEELFAQGQSKVAYRCATAVAGLSDIPPGQLQTDRLARRAERLIRSSILQIRRAVRETAVESDPQAVVAIAEKAGEIVKADAATVVAVARALHAAERTDDALLLLKGAGAQVAEVEAYRRWTGRIAALAEDYQTALDMYGALRADESTTPKIRSEADRFFKSVKSRGIKHLRKLVTEEKFEDAIELATALMQEPEVVERVERELAHMFRRLRAIVLEIEEAEGDKDDYEHALRMILQIRPEDRTMLRRLALELMRQCRFEEAAEMWQRILNVEPSNQSAVRNLERCQKLAQRRKAA